MPEREYLLTLFACPKPFKGHDALIQHNALANWRALNIPVILCGDDPGVAEAAAQYGATHIPDITRTEYGTPLLSDIFQKAQDTAQAPFICYVNADILFPPSLSDVVIHAKQCFPPNFLLVGQRWDVDVSESLDFSGNWGGRFNVLRLTGKLHSPWGMDYFLFNRKLLVLPPFAIGRPGWDNWMIWNARQKAIPLIDATQAIPIIHQNHSYAHVPGRVAANWKDSPEAVYNMAIFEAIRPSHRGWGHATVNSALWRLTPRLRLHRNVTLKKALWVGEVWGKALWSRKFVLKLFIGEKCYALLKKMWHSFFTRD